MADDKFDVQETAVQGRTLINIIVLMMCVYALATAMGVAAVIVFDLESEAASFLTFITSTATLIIGYAFGSYRG